MVMLDGSSSSKDNQYSSRYVVFEVTYIGTTLSLFSLLNRLKIGLLLDKEYSEYTQIMSYL